MENTVIRNELDKPENIQIASQGDCTYMDTRYVLIY